MAVETFTDAVVVDGSQDITQLRVQAHSTQNQPLQTWENSAGTPLARLNSDGRLELGDVTIASTPNAFLEADQGITSASLIKQGVQSRGIVSGAMSDPLAWSVHELEFKDAGGVSTAQKALRGKVVHANTGDSTGADLRAGDFEVENQSGSSGQKVGQATGVHGRVTNGPGSSTAYLQQAAAVRGEIVNNSGDTIDEAAAFEVVAPTNTGTIGTFYGLRVPNLTAGGSNFAIQTGQGPVQFGDSVGIGTVPSTRLHVAQEGGPLNPRLENVGTVEDANLLSFQRARGTLASKTLVNNGDAVGQLSFEAWDGAAYRPVASIEVQIAATPGANDMPGKLVISTTPDGSATPVPAFTINANGSTDLTITDFTNSTHNHQDDQSGGTLNAAVIQYTPAVLTHWNADTDPGDVDDALDQLVARLDALDGGAPVVQGRLSIFSGDPYAIGSNPASSTLYFVPLNNGGYIKLFDGATDRYYLLSQLQLDLSGFPSNQLYDIFIYLDSGVPTLYPVAWQQPPNGTVTNATNATPIVITTATPHGLGNGDVVTISGVNGNTAANGTWRVTNAAGSSFELHGVQTPFALTMANSQGSGNYTSGGTWRKVNHTTARQTPLTTFRNRYVLSGYNTHLWLGTIRTGRTAGQAEDNLLQRFVWNYYNQINKDYAVIGNYIPNTATSVNPEAWNNDYALRFEYVCGLPTRKFSATATGRIDYNGAGYAYALITAGHNAIASSLWNDLVGVPTNIGLAVFNSFAQNHLQPNTGYGYLQAIRQVPSLPSPDFQTFRMTGEFWS